MPQLVYGQDAIVTPWICNLLKMHVPKDSVSIGISSNNQLIGAALYHNYNIDWAGKPLFIEISFGTIDKTWSNRATIHALFAYPFFQLRVKRVQSTVSKKNRAVRSFLTKLGFKLEGTGRLAWPHGGDCCVYSLLSREFFNGKWCIKKSNVLPDSSLFDIKNGFLGNKKLSSNTVQRTPII